MYIKRLPTRKFRWLPKITFYPPTLTEDGCLVFHWFRYLLVI